MIIPSRIFLVKCHEGMLPIILISEWLAARSKRTYIEQTLNRETMMTVTLKEFVRDAISDIMNGVMEAQNQNRFEEGTPRNAQPTIVPNVKNIEGSKKPEFDSQSGRPIDYVDFDVAVTIVDKTESAGEAGIAVAGLKVGGKGGESTEQSSISRVKFRLPVAWPTDDRAI
jgi:hypothetical protein